MIDKLADKIGSYNIFNHLIPGVLFGMLTRRFFGIAIAPDDPTAAAFAYYFAGLVINRTGSLIFEPLFIFTGILPQRSYRRFVATSKEDPKLAVLSETSNMYRSLMTMAFCLLLVRLYQMGYVACPCVAAYHRGLFLLSVAFLFLFSWLKQSRYISERTGENR